MRTPITYYGGKQRMADDIVSMIPGHKIYCEPFFGGGSVFFRKPKAGIEVINDHNNNLINFYYCCQNRFEELQKIISHTLHSETLYMYAKDINKGNVGADEIERAWAVWLASNGSFAGNFNAGWKFDNGFSGTQTARSLDKKRNNFNENLHLRLSEVQISCRDALKVIRDRDAVDTFFYLDPPYPGYIQGHYAGYSHKDFFKLLQLLTTIKGKFILSNYWCQTLKYYIIKNNWNYKSVKVKLNTSHNVGKKQSTREEILVWNYNIGKTLFD